MEAPVARIEAKLSKMGLVLPQPFRMPANVALPSDLILELYGPDIGMHARTSPGMTTPLNAPFLCDAEVEIDGG
jgi:hypothetical protein